MINFVVGFVILLIVGGAIAYIIKEKKKGVKCIGCPDSVQCCGGCSGCSGNCGGDSGCHTSTDTNE